MIRKLGYLIIWMCLLCQVKGQQVYDDPIVLPLCHWVRDKDWLIMTWGNVPNGALVWIQAVDKSPMPFLTTNQVNYISTLCVILEENTGTVTVAVLMNQPSEYFRAIAYPYHN